MKTFCLSLWKINRKKYCVLDKTGEISEQVHPHELTILGWEGDFNHYEPRALPSTQVIPAASSASGCPAYTSTPLRRGKHLLQAACSISGKEAISCLRPNGSWRQELLLKTTHHRKSVPCGVGIFCSPLYPQVLEWCRVHSWALSVC